MIDDILSFRFSEEENLNNALEPYRSESPSRLDELESFFPIGLDIKLTPDNEVKLIEINPCSFGIEGFYRVHEDSSSYILDFLRSFYVSSFNSETFGDKCVDFFWSYDLYTLAHLIEILSLKGLASNFIVVGVKNTPRSERSEDSGMN